MERLTSRDSKGNLCLCNKEVYGNNQDIYNAIAVLEDYENTGITPDQLQVIEEEYSKMAKELAELRQQNRWIPVSEGLPEDGTYICTLDGELCGIDEPFTGMCGIENGVWDEPNCVIAWRLLPEPYKE
jgi:hypothetical protein|nr:MAG TPA: Protein of unknown function (DUF551) [Caudoviricetes sp.]